MDLESLDGAMLHYNQFPRHFPCGLLLFESYFRGSEAGHHGRSSVSSPLSEKTINCSVLGVRQDSILRWGLPSSLPMTSPGSAFPGPKSRGHPSKRPSISISGLIQSCLRGARSRLDQSSGILHTVRSEEIKVRLPHRKGRWTLSELYWTPDSQIKWIQLQIDKVLENTRRIPWRRTEGERPRSVVSGRSTGVVDPTSRLAVDTHFIVIETGQPRSIVL